MIRTFLLLPTEEIPAKIYLSMIYGLREPYTIRLDLSGMYEVNGAAG
jgi:hypothetical protein